MVELNGRKTIVIDTLFVPVLAWRNWMKQGVRVRIANRDESRSSFLSKLMSLLFIAAVATGCSTMPPAQEMSDARQAITAAREAQAERYAAESLREAESFLQRATQDLEQGAYERARRNAVAAKAEAVQARDRALEQATR